jgi:hypothetical protein
VERYESIFRSAKRRDTHRMKIVLRHALSAFASIAILAACSSGGSQVAPPANTPASVGADTRDDVSAHKSGPLFDAPSGFLYVASQDGLTVYGGPSLSFVRVINLGNASGVAVDAQRHVLFGNPSPNRVVQIYTQGGVKQIGTLSRKQDIPYKVAVAPRGDVYVGNYLGYNIFIDGKQNDVKHIHNLPGGQIAVDRSGNFYAGSGGLVRVYKPRSSKIAYTITNGLSAVDSLATDAKGNLYVGNGYLASDPCGNVQVYAPGAVTPSYSIVNGICDPGALTLDADGNLYVANSGYGSSTGTTVTEYDAGTATLARQLGGLSRPTSLTMDSAGDLYVGNTDTNTIDVFLPGSMSPSKSLSKSISAPNTILWAAK